MGAALTAQDVTVLVRDDFVARTAVDENCGNVAHRARRQEDSGFLAEQCGRPGRRARARLDRSRAARRRPRPLSWRPSLPEKACLRVE